MITLTSPSYATTETQVFQAWHKQKQRRVRKSHNPSFIVSYPYVTNYMPSPFDPSGWSTVANGIKTIIQGENPSGVSEFALLDQTGTGYYTPLESYDENLSVLAGDVVYQCLIVKAVNGSNDFSFSMFTDGVNETGKSLIINGDTLDVKSSQYDDVKITELTDGWKLIQGKRIITVDDPDMLSRVTFLQPDSGLAAPIGSQLYAQAAFFGKADDFPANVMPTL